MSTYFVHSSIADASSPVFEDPTRNSKWPKIDSISLKKRSDRERWLTRDSRARDPGRISANDFKFDACVSPSQRLSLQPSLRDLLFDLRSLLKLKLRLIMLFIHRSVVGPISTYCRTYVTVIWPSPSPAFYSVEENLRSVTWTKESGAWVEFISHSARGGYKVYRQNWTIHSVPQFFQKCPISSLAKK